MPMNSRSFISAILPVVPEPHIGIQNEIARIAPGQYVIFRKFLRKHSRVLEGDLVTWSCRRDRRRMTRYWCASSLFEFLQRLFVDAIGELVMRQHFQAVPLRREP